jgi:molybdopterin/thiamine biosynthesis adenylyltransferase
MSVFFHEQIYRSSETLARVRACAVTVCGAGALGANVCESLARQGFGRLRVIDRDRVEERNLSTQPYYRADIGARKAQVLTNALYRALGVEVDARTDELTTANAAQLLGESTLVVDAFDNSAARQAVKDYCAAARVPCLHAGLAGDYAEVIWNESYRVPSPAQDDICDYALARNLVTLAVAVVCETVVSFVATGAQHSFTITLRDLAVRPFELS